VDKFFVLPAKTLPTVVGFVVLVWVAVAAAKYVPVVKKYV
jgi:hypothetical protein